MTSAGEAVSSPLWYAIWTRSHHEQVVQQQLVQKRIEAFLPTVTRWSQWKDRRKQVAWPLFPGYCFARFDGANRLPVLTCRGVLSIVSCQGAPAPVPESEVDSLRVLIEQRVECDPCPMIAEGATVQVIRGPLSGVVGRLLSKRPKQASVIVSVELIGRAVRVDVCAADIALV